MPPGQVFPGYFGDQAFNRWQQHSIQKANAGKPIPDLAMGAYRPDGDLVYTDQEKQNYGVFAAKRIAFMEDWATKAAGPDKIKGVKKDGTLTAEEVFLYLRHIEGDNVHQLFGSDMDAGALELTQNFMAFHDVDGDNHISLGEMTAKTMLETNVVGALRPTLATEEASSGSRPTHRMLYTNILRKGEPKAMAWLLGKMLQGGKITDKNQQGVVKKLVAALNKMNSPQEVATHMANNSDFDKQMSWLYNQLKDTPEWMDDIPFSDFEAAFYDANNKRWQLGLLDGRYFTEVGKQAVRHQWFHPSDTPPSVNLQPLQAKYYGNNQLNNLKLPKKTVVEVTKKKSTQPSSKNSGFDWTTVLGGGLLIFALIGLLGNQSNRR